MYKYCMVNFNVDGGFGKNEYTYKTKITNLREGEVVIVQVRDELSRAVFTRYIDESDITFPLENIKELLERSE